MKIDIHVHTTHLSSCSRLEPQLALNRAADLGLDGIVITEHQKLWPSQDWRELKKMADKEGILILNGLEYRCYDQRGFRGDFLVFGPEETPPPGLSIDRLLKLVHQRQGAVIPAHPCRFGLAVSENVWDLPIDAVEVYNGNQTPGENRESVARASHLGLPMVGGSDAHSVEGIGRYFTDFAAAVSSIKTLTTFIKEGRCKPQDAMILLRDGTKP